MHVRMGIEKACASVLGPNLVEVRLGGGAFVVAPSQLLVLMMVPVLGLVQ